MGIFILERMMNWYSLKQETEMFENETDMDTNVFKKECSRKNMD